MTPEGGVGQRGLVDRSVVFGDAERRVRYLFPFVDWRWRVPFVVVDLLGDPPKILEGALRQAGYQYRTPIRLDDLRAIESVPLADFSTLIHFDPWWVFRGVSGVDRAWVEAVFATNIAHPFEHAKRSYKIRDVIFSNALDRLERIDARRGIFQSATFQPGDLDLLALRAAPNQEPRAQVARTAKAL